MLKAGDLVIANCNSKKMKSFMNGYTYVVSERRSFWHGKQGEQAHFLLWSKKHNNCPVVPVIHESKNDEPEDKRIASMGGFFWFESELIVVSSPPIDITGPKNELPLF